MVREREKARNTASMTLDGAHAASALSSDVASAQGRKPWLPGCSDHSSFEDKSMAGEAACWKPEARERDNRTCILRDQTNRVSESSDCPSYHEQGNQPHRQEYKEQNLCNTHSGTRDTREAENPRDDSNDEKDK
jgi:hypothetical protein